MTKVLRVSRVPKNKNLKQIRSFRATRFGLDLVAGISGSLVYKVHKV